MTFEAGPEQGGLEAPMATVLITSETMSLVVVPKKAGKDDQRQTKSWICHKLLLVLAASQ